MTRRSSLIAWTVALLSLGTTALAQAQPSPRATVQVHIGGPQFQHAPHLVQYQPPPPPRYEARPRPRRGMHWVPGHWEWRNHRHVWTQGHWIKERPGYRHRDPRWVQRDGGRWHMQPGGWDRDGDGVPNRHDRRPDNPYRR